MDFRLDTNGVVRWSAPPCMLLLLMLLLMPVRFRFSIPSVLYNPLAYARRPPRANGDAVERRAAHNTHVCELKLPALARPLARQLPAAPTQGRIAAGVHDR